MTVANRCDEIVIKADRVRRLPPSRIAFTAPNVSQLSRKLNFLTTTSLTRQSIQFLVGSSLVIPSRIKMSTEYDFNNKVVLITGSSGGLGSHIAKAFAMRGAITTITGRNSEVVAKVAAECTSLSPNGVEAFPYVADITKKESLSGLVDAVVQKFGRIDVLINNAGGGAFSSIYDEKLLDTLDHMLTLDLKSVVALTQLVMPHLEKRNGSVVCISSILGQRPNTHFMPYCVAKAAVDMFAKCIALEVGPKGVRVNCVSPTAIRTNFQTASGAGQALEGVLKHLEETIPLRRITTVDDVANAVLFLASDKSSFITGANIVVDGGNSQM